MPDIFELIFLPLLIHLSSTPHPFSTLFGGQWGSKGPKEMKIRATRLPPKRLGTDSQVGTALQAGAKNRTKETKPHLLWQALPPFSETPSCTAVLVPVCTWLSQEAAGDAALQLALMAAPLWLPPHTSGLSHCLLLLFPLLSGCLDSTAHTQLFAAPLSKGYPQWQWWHSQVFCKIGEGVDRKTFKELLAFTCKPKLTSFELPFI